jgi:hypothetical protein
VKKAVFRRITLIVLSIVGVLTVVAVSYAQIQTYIERGRYGEEGNYVVRRPAHDSFNGTFTFCRLAIDQAPDGDGGGWDVDYPRADENLSIRLSELTKTPVNKDGEDYPVYFIITLSDPELFQCPFLMLTEPGGARIKPAEAETLRQYLDKGGFLWSDDFWGTYAWNHWIRELRRVLPEGEYPVVDLPMAHPIFHTLFDVKKVPQIPSISWAAMGVTSERGPDSAVATARAIVDSRSRVIVLLTHNTDFGDSYEREGDSPNYFYRFSVDGYAVGIDVALYAMTH